MEEEKRNTDISIDGMREKIEQCGHKGVWLAIEKIGKWQDRIAFRQVFFLAGGELEDN